MRMRILAGWATLLIVGATLCQTPVQAQEPDEQPGITVAEMLEAGDFNPTDPNGWADAFAEAGDMMTAFAIAVPEVAKSSGGGVIIGKGSTPSGGIAIVTLADGTEITYIWSLGNPPSPKNPDVVWITYDFPDGTTIDVTITNDGSGPVITFGPGTPKSSQ